MFPVTVFLTSVDSAQQAGQDCVLEVVVPKRFSQLAMPFLATHPWQVLLPLCTHMLLQGIGLALSLHAPNQDLRIQIVPSAKAYHINKLIQVREGVLCTCFV